MVFEKRLKQEEIGHLDDSEYRELLRQDLAKRRRVQARGRNRSGEVMISVLLLMAFAVVVMHYMAIIEIPIK